VDVGGCVRAASQRLTHGARAGRRRAPFLCARSPERSTDPHSRATSALLAGSHKKGDDEWGCISRCVECKNSLITNTLPEGAKVFVIVQASGRVISRYHCPRKVDGKLACGVSGTCNLPVNTIEGARALKIECDKLVAKLEAGSSDVDFLLKNEEKAVLLAKYRKASGKHAAPKAGGGGGVVGGGGAAGGGAAGGVK